MLTYLNISRKHLEEIIKGDEATLRKERSVVYYTRTFDYLVKEERDELLETLYWLEWPNNARSRPIHARLLPLTSLIMLFVMKDIVKNVSGFNNYLH